MSDRLKRHAAAGLALFAMFGTSSVRAAEKDRANAAEMLKSGVLAHDAGRYEEAIAIYQAALALAPGEPKILYELALSFQSAGRFAECVETAKPLAKLEDKDRNLYLSLQASCIDASGEPKKAAKLFDKALDEFPDDANLLFNAGLTRIRTEEPRKAIELLKRSVAARPTHPSSHLYLGVAFERAGFEMPAMLAYIRFLTLAPGDARAPSAAQNVRRLLYAGIEKKPGGDVNLFIDPNASMEEGDYRTVEMMRTISGAAADVGDDKDKSVAEKLVKHLDLVLEAIEAPTSQARPDFARATYLPVTRSLRADGLLEPFVYRSFAALNPEAFGPWVAANPAKIQALDEFVRGHGGR